MKAKTISAGAHSEVDDAPLRILLSQGNHGLALDERRKSVTDPVEVRFRRNSGRPLPGDLAFIDAHGAVSAIRERRNVFGRGGHRGRFQAVAANLETLLIVIAPEPAPSFDLLHRYLAAAHIQGIRPLVVVNKSDLPLPDTEPFDHLQALDAQIVYTRCEPQAELDGLRESLGRGIHLLAGQSGVGKTSLANVLLPDLELQTESLSRATGKGRHTTTSARLFRMPGGGWLLDTPGVWEYGLWQMPAVDLARGFPEFAALSPCRFRDCRHQQEPGCSVRAAVADGRLPEVRHRAWLSLLREQQRLGPAPTH